jgi:hypothetical protein
MLPDATVSILPDMGRHRREDESPKDHGKNSGKHVTKRVAVAIPEAWHSVMRQLAAKKRQPVVWHIIELAMAEANKLGIPCPPPPWEAEGDPGK